MNYKKTIDQYGKVSVIKQGVFKKEAFEKLFKEFENVQCDSYCNQIYKPFDHIKVKDGASDFISHNLKLIAAEINEAAKGKPSQQEINMKSSDEAIRIEIKDNLELYAAKKSEASSVWRTADISALKKNINDVLHKHYRYSYHDKCKWEEQYAGRVQLRTPVGILDIDIAPIGTTVVTEKEKKSQKEIEHLAQRHREATIEKQQARKKKQEDKMKNLNLHNDVQTILKTYASYDESTNEWVTKKSRKLKAELLKACKKHYGTSADWLSIHSSQSWQLQVTSIDKIKIRQAAKDEKIEPDLTPKKDSIMSNFKQQFISDGKKVALRQGTRRSTALVHGFILHVLKTNLKLDDTELGVAVKFLKSDYGRAVLSYLIGQGIVHLPEGLVADKQELLQELATEFRVQGMDAAADAGLNKLFELGLQALPAFTALLNAMDTTAQGNAIAAAQAWAQVDAATPDNIKAGMRIEPVDTTPTRIETNQETHQEMEARIRAEVRAEMQTEMDCDASSEVQQRSNVRTLHAVASPSFVQCK